MIIKERSQSISQENILTRRISAPPPPPPPAPPVPASISTSAPTVYISMADLLFEETLSLCGVSFPVTAGTGSGTGAGTGASASGGAGAITVSSPSSFTATKDVGTKFTSSEQYGVRSSVNFSSDRRDPQDRQSEKIRSEPGGKSWNQCRSDGECESLREDESDLQLLLDLLAPATQSVIKVPGSQNEEITRSDRIRLPSVASAGVKVPPASKHLPHTTPVDISNNSLVRRNLRLLENHSSLAAFINLGDIYDNNIDQFMIWRNYLQIASGLNFLQFGEEEVLVWAKRLSGKNCFPASKNQEKNSGEKNDETSENKADMSTPFRTVMQSILLAEAIFPGQNYYIGILNSFFALLHLRLMNKGDINTGVLFLNSWDGLFMRKSKLIRKIEQIGRINSDYVEGEVGEEGESFLFENSDSRKKSRFTVSVRNQDPRSFGLWEEALIMVVGIPLFLCKYAYMQSVRDAVLGSAASGSVLLLADKESISELFSRNMQELGVNLERVITSIDCRMYYVRPLEGPGQGLSSGQGQGLSTTSGQALLSPLIKVMKSVKIATGSVTKDGPRPVLETADLDSTIGNALLGNVLLPTTAGAAGTIQSRNTGNENSGEELDDESTIGDSTDASSRNKNIAVASRSNAVDTSIGQRLGVPVVLTALWGKSTASHRSDTGPLLAIIELSCAWLPHCNIGDIIHDNSSNSNKIPQITTHNQQDNDNIRGCSTGMCGEKNVLLGGSECTDRAGVLCELLEMAYVTLRNKIDRLCSVQPNPTLFACLKIVGEKEVRVLSSLLCLRYMNLLQECSLASTSSSTASTSSFSFPNLESVFCLESLSSWSLIRLFANISDLYSTDWEKLISVGTMDRQNNKFPHDMIDYDIDMIRMMDRYQLLLYNIEVHLQFPSYLAIQRAHQNENKNNNKSKNKDKSVFTVDSHKPGQINNKKHFDPVPPQDPQSSRALHGRGKFRAGHDAGVVLRETLSELKNVNLLTVSYYDRELDVEKIRERNIPCVISGEHSSIISNYLVQIILSTFETIPFPGVSTGQGLDPEVSGSSLVSSIVLWTLAKTEKNKVEM